MHVVCLAQSGKYLGIGTLDAGRMGKQKESGTGFRVCSCSGGSGRLSRGGHWQLLVQWVGIDHEKRKLGSTNVHREVVQ